MSAVLDECLAPAELVRRDELEDVVQRSIRSFVEVGEALGEIRDSRLYRDTHTTFEAYLSDRWTLSRAHGYHLIASARATAGMSSREDIPSEKHARELIGLEPDRADAVWQAANDATGGKPTAAAVREARHTIEAGQPIMVDACPPDESFADGLRVMRKFLTALVRNPSPSEAEALKALLTSILQRLERIK